MKDNDLVKADKERMESYRRPMDNTEYNRRMQQDSLENQRQSTVTTIAKLENKLFGTQTMELYVTDVMDLVEEIIKTCGGESKPSFLDVSYDFIRVQTRVPMTANLFQYLPEDDKNPRFHKIVTRLLLQIKKVHGVRWLPSEDRGSYIVISLKRE